MRMNENEIQEQIYDLDYNHPPREDIWDIDSNTRRVYIPPQFRWIVAVQGDHYSEILTFRIDRYFDGVDLSQKTCIVQFLNAGGKAGTYQVQKMDTTTEPGKIIFQWAVDNVATQFSGELRFIIRFYSTNGKGLYDFTFNTVPRIVLVHEGLDVTDEAEKLYPTILMEWMEIVVKCKYLLENSDAIIQKFIETATQKIDDINDLYNKIHEMLDGISWDEFIAQVQTHENSLNLIEDYLFGKFSTNHHRMEFTYKSMVNVEYGKDDPVRHIKVLSGVWNEAL
mgnify:FL=1